VRSLDDYPEQTVDPVHATEVRDWLTHGLNRLPPEQRLTLELTYLMGYSVEEIAAISKLASRHRQGSYVPRARKTARISAGARRSLTRWLTTGSARAVEIRRFRSERRDRLKR